MKKGFTLIEMLGVIAILAILALLVFPAILNMIGNTEKGIDDATKQLIYTATNQYTNKHKNDFPKDEYSLYCLKVRDLISEDLLASNIVENPDINIEVMVYNNEYQYTILNENESCRTLYKDNSGASYPDLVAGMIPVIYENNTWKVADVTQKWYDYDTKEWANIVVLNDGVNKTFGDALNIDTDVAMMYVWVPRFEYKLPAESIGTTGTPKAIDIKFISKDKTVPTDGYSFHPGFNFGDVTKDGLWFGKFDSSTSGNTSTNAVQKVIIKPNVPAWNINNNYNTYQSSLNIVSDYNLNGVDSHMSRYLEWTTASYLTNSIYGRCSDANTCVEVTINNNSNYITGMAGKTVSAEATTDTYTYETTGGVLASTTGNIYGIYDMSGGAWEDVMAVLSDQNGNPYSSSDSSINTGFNGPYSNETGERIGEHDFPLDGVGKYYDLFVSLDGNVIYYNNLLSINDTTNIAGTFQDLFGSVSSSNYIWYGDMAGIQRLAYPWLALGGHNGHKEIAGLYHSHYSTGTADSTGFRVIMVQK